MHILMRRSLTLLLAALLLSGAFAAERPLQVVAFSASKEYRSAESLPLLKAAVETAGAKCQLFPGEDKGALPGSETLEKADVAVVFIRRIKLPPGDLARWKAFCAAGKGIVGIRTASHAFDGWPEFDREILGGDYSGHRGDKPAKIVVLNPSHFILRGFEPFPTNGKLYKNAKPAPDIIPLLRATTDEASEPVAWARERAPQRIFYTSLGTPEDFQTPAFIQLLTRAIYWTAHRELDAPTTP
jgi:type 1 glutamine amidotransferase